MPWCPICKNEYVKGYTHCSDCNAELIESLEDAPKAIIFGEEEPVNKMAEFLQASGIYDASVRFDDKEKVYELYVPADKEQESKAMIAELMRRQAQAAAQAKAKEEEASEIEMMDEDGKKSPDRRKSGAYEDKNAKAGEYRSSAISLIVVGLIGIIALVLFWMGVLPFRMYGMGKIMFSGVMGFMFLVFLVMGFHSIKMYKTYLGVASKENSLIDEINAFLDAMPGTDVDVQLGISSVDATDDAAQAQLYFVRMEYVKKKLFETFPELDMPLADKLADDWYNKQYD